MHDLFEQLAVESFLPKDLADLIGLAVGDHVDVLLFDAADSMQFFLLRLRAEVIADRHAEPISDEIRRAKHDDHGRR